MYFSSLFPDTEGGASSGIIRMILPAAFLERIRETTGPEVDQFLSSLDQPPPVSVRINPLKPYNGFSTYEKVPWATGAFYLPERISFTLDPRFHAGCYYVQEASSMFLEQVIRDHAPSDRPLRVLDLCAAPGGKSTQLISVLPPGSLLVSNEVVPARNNTLRYNLEKWGHPEVIVTQSDPSQLGKLHGFFDVIVVDAPCSGEGLFRKDPDAVSEWSKEAVTVCARRQYVILQDILPALKQDGLLVYSTCTYEYEENEQQVAELITESDMELIPLKAAFDGIFHSSHGIRFYPHKIKGEGFFISALRKKGNQEALRVGSGKQHPMKMKGWNEWLGSHKEAYTGFAKDQEIYAIPTRHFGEFQLLSEKCFVRKAGIHIGTAKGDDLVPAHDLAMSVHLSSDVLRHELNETEALQYLRCQPVQVPPDIKGWAVVTYNGFALGWIKALDNRVNNYFPKNQRILMS